MNPTSTRFAGSVVASGLLIITVICGCGKNDDLDLVPVAGKVILPAGPLAGIGVSFRPDTTKGNSTPHIPSGTTDTEGKYELITGGRKGAPPGWYKVVLAPPTPGPTGGEMPKSTPSPFAAKYQNVTTTDLQIEVKSGATPGAYDLKLDK